MRTVFNRPFPSCCEPHFESEATCKTFHMKISFVCITMKTHFHTKNFAHSLAFIMRFRATRKWSIEFLKTITKVICPDQLNIPVNQSELEANTCYRRQARENAYEQVTIGFGFASHWLRK